MEFLKLIGTGGKMLKKVKTVRVKREVWQKLQELRVNWEKRTLNEVVEELLKRGGIE